MNLRSVIDNRNAWMTTCFVAYVLLFFVFGAIYHAAFKAKPSQFLFNSDVLKTQALEFKSVAATELLELHTQLFAYTELLDELSQKGGPKSFYGPQVIITTAKYKFTFNRVSPALLPSDEPRPPTFEVTIQDSDGAAVQSAPGFYVGNAFAADFFQDYTIKSLANIKYSISEYERRLASLESSSPEVWSYWDFLYFSVVTQTTVGYGDVLPNSTFVRMTVVSQIISGLAIVTVLIGISFRSRIQPELQEDVSRRSSTPLSGV